jgi:hypothetical protein
VDYTEYVPPAWEASDYEAPLPPGFQAYQYSVCPSLYPFYDSC